MKRHHPLFLALIMIRDSSGMQTLRISAAPGIGIQSLRVCRVEKQKQPVAARYGWADKLTGNHHNAAGLPALPFCTDAVKH